ncbi:hypothetical protein DE146DRAFT_634397 [Phaeosphaeria sp. MPI-PUGE-AT-0046c]|nr:hypothetical protein DE146DRAFT_634397 [Phaeosphaeria sp. MPI-PUGE-AT-0046c]
MADDNFEDDIFDDLYDDEPASKAAPAAPAPAPQAEPEPVKTEAASAPPQDTTQNGADNGMPSWQAPAAAGQDAHMDQSGYNAAGNQSFDNAPMGDDNYGSINVKEDGVSKDNHQALAARLRILVVAISAARKSI